MSKEKEIQTKLYRSPMRENIIRLIALLIILIAGNYVASFVFTRFDLTSEKRFTISPTTKELVKNLDDIVYFKVYLEGEFPSGFKRLRNSTKEMLDELRAYSDGKIEYEFINPSASTDEKTRNEVYRQLYEKGLQPTDLEEKGKDGVSTKVIFPGALVVYRGQDQPVHLLKNKIGASPEEMLNNSIQALEYEIANTIRKVTQKVPSKVGILKGHGESEYLKIADLLKSLAVNYSVDTLAIDGKLGILDKYKLIIIPKPTEPFPEKDKFVLDQFIMKGGRVLWFIDNMDVDMDSLQSNVETIAMGRMLNLDDMLFRYGVRVNADLMLDLKAAPVPIVTGYIGNQPRQSLLPWYFFPLLSNGSDHPIVKNLNSVKSEFVSSIDTVGNAEIKKTILLASSQYTRVLLSPVRVNLNIMKEEPKPEQYNKKFRPAAVLLEGKFESVFKNRLPPELTENSEFKFKEQGELSRMIVVSDGDIVENKIRRSAGSFYPMGYDRYTNQTYGNKSFVLNCVDYLCDDSGLISLRGKELKLRLLDRSRTDAESTTWQIINLLVPVLLILLFGLFKMYRRKRKYAS